MIRRRKDGKLFRGKYKIVIGNCFKDYSYLRLNRQPYGGFGDEWLFPSTGYGTGIFG